MIDFKLIAGTNIGLRENNEDNFTVCADLAQNDWRIPVNYQEEIKLGDLGCIMVVADGMGGQNAGEVASSIAVETIHSMFAPDALPKGVTASEGSIDEYLKKVICAADLRVKKMTRENPSTSGMGSTIVIAWIIGNRAHIAWLGDSRAYCIIKDKGIARLTKDHSYVQALVDAGRITDEQALTHPDSNIINRSLGDTSQKAKPDVMSIELTEGEVILLCTDGLCGVCQDSVIGGIVEENITDLRKCREDLMAAALASGGSDNITVAMLHVCKCDVTASASATPPDTHAPRRKMKWNLLIYGVLVAVIGALAYMLLSEDKQVEDADSGEVIVTDTIKTQKPDLQLIEIPQGENGDNHSNTENDANVGTTKAKDAEELAKENKKTTPKNVLTENPENQIGISEISSQPGTDSKFEEIDKANPEGLIGRPENEANVDDATNPNVEPDVKNVEETSPADSIDKN